MPGSSTTPGRSNARTSASVRVAFHVSNRVGIRDVSLSQLNGWPTRSPVNASLTPSRMPVHDWGHCGLLDLQCGGLAPPTPCRFYRRTRKTPFSESLEKLQAHRGFAALETLGETRLRNAPHQEPCDWPSDDSQGGLAIAIQFGKKIR